MKSKIILVHGFNKTYKDTDNMSGYFSQLGYDVENLSLPLTFPSFDMSVQILEEYLRSLENDEDNSFEKKVALVGFGMGGMIIKNVLTNGKFNHLISTVVFVGSPLKDSTLSRRLKRLFPFITFIFKPLKVFSKTNSDFTSIPGIDVGVIIGNYSIGPFSFWLGRSINDGIVNLKECVLKDAVDTLVIPLCHQDLNKKIGVAKYIDNFINYRKFKPEI